MRWRAGLLGLAVAAMAGVTGVAAQDAKMGAEVFHRCALCHEIGPGAVNRLGPVLNDVIGRQAGTVPDFPYRTALTAAGQGGLAWTPETLAPFLAKPRHFEPGTGMIFPGLDNPNDVADVIAYLETYSDPELAERRLGESLVTAYCASCHAVGKTGESPHAQAPPFRMLHERYDVTDLTEALVEGLVSGHPDMPEFEFEPEQAAAIVAYLKSLE